MKTDVIEKYVRDLEGLEKEVESYRKVLYKSSSFIVYLKTIPS